VGWYAYLLGEYDQAARDSATALEMHAAARNDGGVRISLVNLAWVDARRGDLTRAEGRMTEALAIAHRRGDLRSVAYVANCLCAILLQRGEHARALSLSREAIRVADATSDKLTSAATHERRATGLRDTGRLDEAYAELAGQVMPTMRQSSHKRAIAFGLWQLGQVCTDLGRLDEARAALDESLAICTQLRHRTSIAECEAQLAEVERRSGAVGAALARARTALRLRAALGETVAAAASLEGVARIAAELGDDAAAVSLIGGASRTRERCGAPLAPVDRTAMDALLDALRARLGDAFGSAWAEGCAALPDSLVARALAIGS
jgi:tetratricopeptide (TPR) repeat protein